MSFVVKKSHNLISNLPKKDICIDATIGNGNDALFLSSLFNKIYGFDIQELAIKRSKEKLKDHNNVTVIHDNFINIDMYNIGKVDLVLYNLGFLPGSNRRIVTKVDDSIISINKAIKMINNEGVVLINCYLRHPGGKHEYEGILFFLNTLDNIDKKLHTNSDSVDVLIEIRLK